MSDFYMGVDASKGYSDFVLLDKQKRIVEANFQLDDTFFGHQALCKFLEDFLSQHQGVTIYGGVECTGGYENNWYNLLWKLQERFNINVSHVNPYGVKHYKEASLERIDTDKISAKKIAEYLITYPEKVTYNQEDYFAPLRRHWKVLRLLKKQCAQLLNQLESQLYVAQPQILRYCSDGVYDWVLQVLKRYPTAEKLALAKTKELSIIPYVTKQRAKELIEDAKNSVASTQGTSMETIIKSLAQQILNLRKTINDQVKVLIRSYDFPEIKILTSFTGIAEYSAFGLLLEIGAIERFSSVKKLASFFGLHPVYKQSGDGTWKMRMSKKGRKEPRWLLFNIAKNAIVKNEMIKQLYEGYVQEGKSKMSAIGIIMHKVLRIVYGMLKNKTMYDPEIDKRYRDRNKKRIKETEKKAIIKVDKNRRLQPYDPKAPISGRQMKTRKLKEVKNKSDEEEKNKTQKKRSDE